jgi:hypothetical protein
MVFRLANEKPADDQREQADRDRGRRDIEV